VVNTVSRYYYYYVCVFTTRRYALFLWKAGVIKERTPIRRISRENASTDRKSDPMQSICRRLIIRGRLTDRLLLYIRIKRFSLTIASNFKQVTNHGSSSAPRVRLRETVGRSSWGSKTGRSKKLLQGTSVTRAARASHDFEETRKSRVRVIERAISFASCLTKPE